MAQSLEAGYPSFIGDAYPLHHHAPDISIPNRTPRKTEQRIKLKPVTNLVLGLLIIAGANYGCTVGPAGIEAVKLPQNPAITLTGIPDSATGVAETPTPQDGVQEPTLVDVPFLSPTADIPSITPDTPEASPTTTEIQPSATAINTATPEASPTEEGLWCNKDPYWIKLNKELTALYEKDPNAVPTIKDLPFSIANYGDDPETEQIEPQQCTGLTKDGPKGFATLKTWGFSDDAIKDCEKKNHERFIGENFNDSDLWKLIQNWQWKFIVNTDSFTCEWKKFPLFSEDRKRLKIVNPELP